MRKLTLSAFAVALVAVSVTGAKAQAPANDNCSGAINLTTAFGQTVNQVVYSGPYNNTLATTNASDPATGYECFGEPDGAGAAPELNNTIWFSFVGDGGLYFIETSRCNPPLSNNNYIDDGDTQIAIYTGTCGSLTPAACNEDGPSATATTYPAGLNFQTTAGTTYYMMVDGFSFQGAVSRGQFCINVKQLPLVTCADPTISAGTSTGSDSLVCFGDTLTVTSTGVVAPTVGTGNGVSWVISSADISGSNDPLNEPSFITSYVVTTPAPSTSIRILPNNGTFFGAAGGPAYGTYYWTPVVFANATQTTAGTPFLQNFTLDTACTFVGTSIMATIAAPGSAACGGITTPGEVCTTARDITSSFGQAVNQVVYSGPYDNNSATTDPSDPATGYECFGEPDGAGAAPELNNTLWFSFVGDGGLYFIETSRCNPPLSNANYIDDGDTQIAIYTGACGSLTPAACNEDGPSATATTYPAGLNFPTTAGTTYYMMVDGFSFQGTVSTGQFCINVKKLPQVTCTDPTVTIGTGSATKSVLCFGDTVTVTTTGVVAPTVGSANGITWVLTSADISGSPDPAGEPSFVGSYPVVSPVPATFTRNLINNGTFVGSAGIPYGTYYFTPVVFANATNSGASTNLSNYTLDPACTFTGTSLAVNILAQGSPLCVTAMADLVKGGFMINSLFPVPVQNMLNVQLTAGYGSAVTITVKDLLGRDVTSRNFNAVTGENNFSLDMAKEASGVYFVTVSNGRNSAVSKFVKE